MDIYESAEYAAIVDSRFVTAEQVAPPVGVVTQCDIAEGIPTIASPRVGTRTLVLVRMFSEPIGILSRHLPAVSLDPDNLARAIVRNFGPRLRERFADCGRQLSELSDDFPRELLWANRIGLFQGPFTYAAAQVHAWRLRRAVLGW